MNVTWKEQYQTLENFRSLLTQVEIVALAHADPHLLHARRKLSLAASLFAQDAYTHLSACQRGNTYLIFPHSSEISDLLLDVKNMFYDYPPILRTIEQLRLQYIDFLKVESEDLFEHNERYLVALQSLIEGTT